MILANSLEPIQCTLTNLERERVSEYHSGDRYGFPSYITHGQYRIGTLMVLSPTDCERITNNAHRHFILTNDHEKTYLADCSITGGEITRNFNDYKCRIDFRINRIGERSLSIPDWEISPINISDQLPTSRGR